MIAYREEFFMEHAKDIYEAYIDSDDYFLESGRQPKVPTERLHYLKEHYHMTEEEYTEIEDVVFAACSLGEMQGFVNGLDCCEKILNEKHDE